MKPKEKAIEIHTKMFLVKDGLHKYPMCFDTAKQCALIAVDEIIISHEMAVFCEYIVLGFWKEVKLELEKL